MVTREQYLGNVIFSDPTAERAIGNVSRFRAAKPATEITSISHELQELRRRKWLGEITRAEFMKLRAPLVVDYHALLQVHLARKGGE